MSLPFDPGPKNFVLFVENTLGCAPDVTKERWRAVILEASKVKKKIATNPTLYTWENLALTVEWLRQKRKVVRSAAAVLWNVEDALRDSANTRQPDQIVNVAVAIKEAIAWEQANRIPGYQGWVGRLTRAAGDGRQDTYTEWKAARIQ